MSETKLTRTQSSLLRSSSTVRSSIHSLSSIDEIQEEDKKPHKPSLRSRPGSNRLIRVFSVISFALFYLTIFYLRTEKIPTSQNLLLLLVLISVTLFLAGKNKSSINQSLAVIRHLCDQHSNKLSFLRRNGKPVQWFIGEDENIRVRKNLREGVEFYSNGNFYEGEFHKGKCNGSGVYNYFVNGRYEGDWVDGRYDGHGVESWARGSRYRGQYSQGMRHGFGVYKFYTGDAYAGEWCNGQSHGVGVQTCSDGSCYVGEFKFGVKHGLGFYHFRNGDRYSGEYFGDKIHGFGVYHFSNGHCYEGSWHEGRKQGYGMYAFRNGEPQFGEWDGGVVRHPFVSLTDPVIHAVETARKMGENAKCIRRVDQQVSRAVMAANRAATAARVAAIKAVQNRMGG